jgi:hypothetical protein
MNPTPGEDLLRRLFEDGTLVHGDIIASRRRHGPIYRKAEPPHNHEDFRRVTRDRSSTSLGFGIDAAAVEPSAPPLICFCRRVRAQNAVPPLTRNANIKLNTCISLRPNWIGLAWELVAQIVDASCAIRGLFRALEPAPPEILAVARVWSFLPIRAAKA